MAKTLKKKTNSSKGNKVVSKKSAPSKKSQSSNKKTKSATSKKSVSKNSVSKEKSSPKKRDSAPIPPVRSETRENQIIRTDNPQNNVEAEKNPIVLTEAKLPEETKKMEINYNDANFEVAAAEVGFLKLPDGNFGVKLTAGIKVKRRDELNFEFSGKQADGTPFGTIFDCVDKNEADAFMNELIAFSKSGEIKLSDSSNTENVQPAINTQPTQNTQTTEQVFEHGQNQVSEVNPTVLESYKGVPLKTEDMNKIIDTMKINEQNNQNNSQMNVNPIVNNPIQPTNNPPVDKSVFTQNPAINIQPPISNTHTPDANFNSSIPSQNPNLIYDPNNPNQFHNQHNNPNPAVMMNDEQVLSGMRAYANSIEDTLNQTFQVRMHGKLPESDFREMLKGCVQTYAYDIKNDGNGLFLTITKDKYQLRVPENPMEYLKIY